MLTVLVFILFVGKITNYSAFNEKVTIPTITARFIQIFLWLGGCNQDQSDRHRDEIYVPSSL